MQDIEKEIADTVAAQAHEDAMGRRAATEPLPGPLRDVFALQPNITVGPFQVRLFYDIDFEFLSALGHPLHKMMVEDKGDYVPRGPSAWQLCFVMTRDVDVVEELMHSKGAGELTAQARKIFGKLQGSALIELNKAIIEQLRIYWSPVVGYGPNTGKDAEGEQPPDPTKSSARP